jgi:nicotinamidase-related amidase
MHCPSLQLARDTPAIFVDPLSAFMELEGTFVQCYGSEDTEPVRALGVTMKAMAREWRNAAELVLCQSLYERNQFSVPGLEELCTEQNRFDRAPVFADDHEEWFKYTIEKHDNSVLATLDRELRGILAATRHLILTGVTTTSCIAKSIEGDDRGRNSLRKELPDLTVVVPRDAVAARVQKSAEAQELLAQWSRSEDKRVIVVESWKNITFTR